jgi:hypothetical protein
MPLNGIQPESHHLQSAPRQTRAILCCGRGAETLHSAYKWSSILQATKPQLPPDLFICGKFTARLTTTKCSSAGLLTAPSAFSKQSPLPWAKETLLHLRRFVPSPLPVQLPPAPIPLLDLLQISSSKCPDPPLPRMRQGKDCAA